MTTNSHAFFSLFICSIKFISVINVIVTVICDKNGKLSYIIIVNYPFKKQVTDQVTN